jgi:MinD-like ATPase involved in chromosome partitioning or flagellar assembly
VDVLIACWSVKGGAGTTVVAAGLAATLARSSPVGAVVADLAGDVPAVLGLAEPSGPGLSEWLAAGDEVPLDALVRLEVDAGHGLAVLPTGSDPEGLRGPGERGAVLAGMLAADARPVVADCGRDPAGAALAVAAGAGTSLLVLRPCYLSLRRAVAAPMRPSGVVVVSEPGRALGADDVEEVLGVPVRARISVDPAIARAVDAGLLAGRLPRGLAHPLRRAA